MNTDENLDEPTIVPPRAPITVIYHGGDCVDGFTSAWAARLTFGDGDNVRYLPAMYGDPLPDVSGRYVWILDFSYPRKDLQYLNEQAASLIVIDHHETAQKNLEGLDFCMFDMNHSGAQLTWQHFKGTRNRFVDYVEDRDLWRFELPHSKEISAYIGSYERTFENWDRLDRELAEINRIAFSEAVAAGKAILRTIEQYVRAVRRHARPCWLNGFTVPIVNAPHVYSSELVGALAEGELFAASWFQRSDKLFQYSLRSRSDFNVATLAEHYGGGGHARAAGFTVPELAHY